MTLDFLQAKTRAQLCTPVKAKPSATTASTVQLFHISILHCAGYRASQLKHQWRIRGGRGEQGAWAPPFSQRTRSHMVRAWLHAMLCALARARVSAFYNAGSCTRAMKKRDIRALTSLVPRRSTHYPGRSD